MNFILYYIYDFNLKDTCRLLSDRMECPPALSTHFQSPVALSALFMSEFYLFNNRQFHPLLQGKISHVQLQQVLQFMALNDSPDD